MVAADHRSRFGTPPNTERPRPRKSDPHLGKNLQTMLAGADIKLVDIGARGGTLPQLHLLASLAHLYACEPDVEEAEALPTKLMGLAQWKKITVIPEAIASTTGERDFYLLGRRGLSSLLKPNYGLVKKYFPYEDWQVTSRISVPTIPLDRAAQQYGFSDACFLKIDTQGTELDILQSGEKLLRKEVLAVYVEAEFQPFYEKQPLFADVDAYLRDLGFTLFDLQPESVRRSTRPRSRYSRRQVIWAHALYMKDPSVWLRQSDGMAATRTLRFLALALAFEHYDLVHEQLSSESMVQPLIQTYGDEFLGDIEALIAQRTKILLSRQYGILNVLKGLIHDVAVVRRGDLP